MLYLIPVYDSGQRVYPVTVDEHIEFRKLCGFKTLKTIIQRGVTPTDRLQAIEEIQHHFRHGNIVNNRHLRA